MKLFIFQVLLFVLLVAISQTGNTKGIREFSPDENTAISEINNQLEFADSLLKIFPDTALKYFELSYDLANKYSSQYNLDTIIYLKALSIHQIGVVHYYQNNYIEALNKFQEALRLFESIPSPHGISQCYNNIGNVHNDLSNFEMSREYYYKSLEIDSIAGDIQGVASSRMNLGNNFLTEGMNSDDSIKYTDLYNKAFDCYNSSLTIYNSIPEENQNEDILASISGCYNGLAIIFKRRFDYVQAFQYYTKSYETDKKLNDNVGMSTVLLNMASMSFEIENYYKVIDYSLKSLEIAISNGFYYDAQMAYEMISWAYYEQNDKDKAFQYHVKFSYLKDSIFNLEKSEQLAEIETKYQTEKKQLQIEKLETAKALQDEEMKKQRILLISFVIGFAFLLILAITIYRQFRFKKRANRLLLYQNKEILQQKAEIEAQRDEIEAQRDRITEQHLIVSEKNKEITDSIKYATRIQNALMPSMDIIKDYVSDFSILYKPRDFVSGDFYWAAKKEDSLIVAAADCTGHGVPGALMSMLGISLLNEITNKHNTTQPGSILNKLRHLIIVSLKQSGKLGESKDGMDISLCKISYQRELLEYAGANNSLYLIKKDNKGDKESILEFEEIKADKMPVSIYRRMNDFTNHEILIEKGTVIYMFSDGFADQFGGEDGKKLKASRFRELIMEVQQYPVNEQCRKLDSAFLKWQGSHDQLDDVCIVAIEL